MSCAIAARSLALTALWAGVLGLGSAAQVPLLVEGTLMSPLEQPRQQTAPMGDCPSRGQRPRTAAEEEAEAFRQRQVSGHALHEGIRGVTKGLHWFENLAAASRAATLEQKPILWLHLLGELDGFA
ncbi:MAG: hypothetical protein IPN34_18500 [Planctomycetes bacterium]|nr:hypothetical protein [Planctomycetota bacterium]